MQPLLLSNDLKVHERTEDCLVIKNIRAKTHMVVNKSEWKLLNRYAKPTSLLDLFPDLIRDRATPELTELIELLLKARRRFILVTLGTQPPPVAPVDWGPKIAYPLANFFSLLCIAIGFVSLVFLKIQFPPNPLMAIIIYISGWAMVCGCLSLGNYLVGCLMNNYDCEIFDTDWKLATLFPHFKFNMKDMPMGGKPCEVVCSQLQLAPIFLFTALASWILPELSVVAMFGLLFSLAPLRNAPMTRFLQSMFRGPQRSVTYDYMFSLPGTGFMGRLGRTLKSLNGRYQFIEGLYAVVWMAVAGLFSYALFDEGNLETIIKDSFGSEVGGYISLGILLALGGSILILGFNKAFEKLKSIAKTDKAGAGDIIDQKLDLSTVGKEHIQELIMAMPFAQKLTYDLIKQLASRAQHNLYEDDQIIYDVGDMLYHYPVVLAGRLAVEQESRSGKIIEMRSIGPGESFGEDELLDEEPVDYRVRATDETCLVFIDKETFKRTVVSRVGRQRIQEVMQKEGLLKDIKFSRSWEKETVQRFAKLCVINEYQDGSIVLPENFDNRFFYIIYAGLFTVRKKRKPVAKLKRGDFFGEISLLQNSHTTSEVVSEEKGKAFTVSKGDFLRFMMTDFSVAIQIEKIASKRLKYPVFPLIKRRATK